MVFGLSLLICFFSLLFLPQAFTQRACFHFFVQQFADITPAFKHHQQIIFIAIGILHALNGALFMAGAYRLPCFVQLRRVKLCRLLLKLGILFEGIVQFYGIPCFACFQLFQTSLQCADFLTETVGSSILWKLHLLKQNSFFRTQFFQILCQLGNPSGKVTMLQDMNNRRFLFLRQCYFSLLGLHHNLICKDNIFIHIFTIQIQRLLNAVFATANMQKLVFQNYHVAPQPFHCICDSGQRVLDRLHQFFDRYRQFTKQGVVNLDLTVDFTPVGYNTFFLQRTSNCTLVNGWLLVQTSLRMASVVNAGIVTVLLQIAICYFCPRLAPLYKLFLTVPALGDGILPTELSAFGIFIHTLIALCFGGRGCHITLFLANFILRFHSAEVAHELIGEYDTSASSNEQIRGDKPDRKN